MLFEACWRQTPSQRPAFAALEALDVHGLAADEISPELADVQRAVDGYLGGRRRQGRAQAAMALEVLVAAPPTPVELGGSLPAGSLPRRGDRRGISLT